MGSSLATLLILATVVSMALLIPFFSINMYLKQIVVLPGGGSIDTIAPAKTRLWASLFGFTFIGFPAAKFVSVESTLVANILGSYDNNCITYFTALILLIGLAAGVMARDPSSGAKAAAFGLLACVFLGAYLTPEILSLSLKESGLSRVQLADLTSSLMVSQFLGGFAAALLSGVMGAIGGAVVWQRKSANMGSSITSRPQTYSRNAAASFSTNDMSPRNPGNSPIWPTCPKCGARLARLLNGEHYICINCLTQPKDS